MLRKALLIAAVLACSPATATSSPSERLPVAVSLTGDDGLTNKLRDALRDALQRHPVLRPQRVGEEPVIAIRSDSNVIWKMSGRGSVVIYTVYLLQGGLRSEPVTGNCVERSMSKCAADIMRVVQVKAQTRSD